MGQSVDAVRFVIGHPLIAALYAPLSLLVSGDGNGGAVLEYGRPSTLFGQFNDPRVTEIARSLDEKLAALIHTVVKPYSASSRQ